MLFQIKLFNNFVVTKNNKNNNKTKQQNMFILHWFYTTTTVNTNKHDKACKKISPYLFKQNCK